MKKVRMIDIANIVGVSKVTVSKVLSQTSANNTKVNPNTAKRILDVARQMYYQPSLAAKQLAGQKSKLIGVLIDANSIFNEYPRVVYEEQSANSRGYRIIIGQCHPDVSNVKHFLDDFNGRAVDGLIMHAHVYPGLTNDMMDACKQFEHVVYYDKPNGDHSGTNYVDINLEAGMEKLIKHIIKTGRKKISYFVPQMKNPLGKHQVYVRKENCFRKVMDDHGLPYDMDFADNYIFPAEPGTDDIKPLVKELIENEKPDAIIARNDDIAAIVLKTLHELGINCPDDIAVAGYDNRQFAEYLHPGLTTVDNNLAFASCTAVETLISLIEGDNDESSKQLTIEPKLIKRNSA